MILITTISLIGVWLFELFGFPVPWMLGPLFAMLISQFFIRKIPLEWPVYLRNFGLVIVGVSIGQSFQFHLFAGMGWLVVFMLILNITLVIASVLLALGVQKVGKISLKTALTSTVPGGLSQIVTFAEEEKDINFAIVTYFHVVRVISIVIIIPFIVSGHIVKPVEEFEFSLLTFWPVVLFITVAWLCAILGKKIKIPVTFFLSPVLLVIGLQVISVDTPEMPVWLLHAAQLLIGAYIGLLLKPKMLKIGARNLVIGIVSALCLLAITYTQGLILVYFLDYSLPTSFLSTAAGGLDQMSLLATAVGADVSIVTVFQMFRLLFVFIVVLPLLKLLCTWIDRKSAQIQRENVDVFK